MLDSQSNDVLLYILSFVIPETLCSSCIIVNSKWYNLINSTPSLWTTWDSFYPFLLPHPPITIGNVKDKVVLEVMNNTRWKACKYKNRHYFEAYRGTLLLNMSLCDNLLATATNDHLVKIWDISCTEEQQPDAGSEYVCYLSQFIFQFLFVTCVVKLSGKYIQTRQ